MDGIKVKVHSIRKPTDMVGEISSSYQLKVANPVEMCHKAIETELNSTWSEPVDTITLTISK